MRSNSEARRFVRASAAVNLQNTSCANRYAARPTNAPMSEEYARICHAFFLSRARNSAWKTVSVFPTSGPKLNRLLNPNAAQKCIFAWMNPVAELAAGKKRSKYQPPLTPRNASKAQRPAVATAPAHPARFLMAVSAGPMLQTPGMYSEEPIVKNSFCSV